MTLLRSSALRHVVAAVLMVVLTLAGVGRSLAATSDMAMAGYGIPGVAFPICHSGGRGDSGPVDRAGHDCCDSCVLLAPLALAEAPSLGGPAAVMGYVEHAQAMAWVPTIARVRTPRQSQGPPTA